MGDQLTASFSGKGMTKNLLELMAMREQFKKCCQSWLTQIVTENSTTIIFSGLGTTISPLTASVVISAASGNSLVANADGLFASAVSISYPITGANDGLSVLGTTVKLGQTIGQAGNPAALTENREVPLAGFDLEFTGSGLVSIGAPHAFAYGPTVFNVTGMSYQDTIVLHGSFVSGWSTNAGIATDRVINIPSRGYGDMIEDLSTVVLQSGWTGYAGAYFTAYVFGAASNPGTLQPNYVSGVSCLPIYDNVGATALQRLMGVASALNTTNGTIVTLGADFYASELNSVSRIGGTGGVITHANFYAEACTRGTTANYGLYVNAPQVNYLGGALSIGATLLGASVLLQLNSTTKGFLPPVMSTTQKNAIVSPATGLVVFDSTLGKLCVFSTTWQTITSA